MKKFKRLYTNGSSITHGWPLCHSRYHQYYSQYYDVIPLKVEGDEHSVESRISINWPNRLATLLDTELVDESRGGGGSIRAMRMCMEYINKNLDTIDDTLFIIETTSGYRDEIFSNRLDRRFNVVTSNCIDPTDITDNTEDRKLIKEELESYFKWFVNQNDHANKEGTLFIGFFSLLKQLGCEFFIVNQAITGHAHAFYKEIYEKIKINDRVIDWEGGDCIVQWYWKEKEYHIGGELEKFVPIETDYHPGYFGHIKIAEHIYKELKKYYGKV